MKIAVVGSGISGLSLAWMLSQKYQVSLFEQNAKLGGHSNTVEIDYFGRPIAVDTGFIVFNHRTYPNLLKLFGHLGVACEKSTMSFGVKNYDTGLEYCGSSISGLFAQKTNLLKPSFWGMLRDIVRFNRKSRKAIEQQVLSENTSLSSYLETLKLGRGFTENYLYPMISAIWSCPLSEVQEYPAKTFLQFFYNHGLLTITNQPQWYTVSGGSKNYVQKLSQGIEDIRLECKITKAYRREAGVVIEDSQGASYEFDQLILASHPDQSLALLKDASEQETKILGNIKYTQNTAILHRDPSHMPLKKKAWASWCYLASQKQQKVSLTYWMNSLQNIDGKYPLFVTLNPFSAIKQESIFGIYNYEHPSFTLEAIAAQKQLPSIQGKGNIWYAGAWTGYGFHEDGLVSALRIAQHFKSVPECLQ